MLCIIYYFIVIESFLYMQGYFYLFGFFFLPPLFPIFVSFHIAKLFCVVLPDIMVFGRGIFGKSLVGVEGDMISDDPDSDSESVKMNS